MYTSKEFWNWVLKARIRLWNFDMYKEGRIPKCLTIGASNREIFLRNENMYSYAFRGETRLAAE